MIRFPEFRSALLAWRRVAIKQLQAGAPANVLPSRSERWGRGANGHYSSEASLEWHPSALDALVETREFGSVAAAAEASPDISKHVGVLIGVPRARARWEVKSAAFQFLPQPAFSDDGGAIQLATIPSFGRLYRALEHFLLADEQPVRVIWPLEGLTVEQSSLTLEPGLVLRRLTESEVSTCIGYGLIARPSSSVPVVWDEGHGFSGLVLTGMSPKLLGKIDGPLDSEMSAKWDFGMREIEEDMLSITAVIGQEEIGLSGWVEIPNWRDRFMTLRAGAGRAYGRWFARRRHISRSEAREIVTVWRRLREVRPANPALGLAARRLSYASERSRAEDQMLDIMIAAEALYLGTGQAAGTGELSYKLSLRSAIWSDQAQVGLARDEVFALMRRAYGVRSVIAHGDSPSTKSLRLNDVQLDLPQLVERSGAVVRAGVRKAIDAAHRTHDRKFAIDWETLLLRQS